ncbi:MAG TPA: rhomboid family intramembrane serine protease [Opitutaceae bacterium]|nr:rhomboid family intramembrane serine protease [Opitutaceae bacterium]
MSPLVDRLERIFGRFAIRNLSLYLVAGQVVVFVFAWFDKISIEQFLLFPALLHAQPWRLLTFLLLPPAASPVFIAFAWWLFYLMGTALEDYWGVFRYNLFLFAGWTLTVAAAFLTPELPATNAFLAGSVFLAFAYLNPDFELAIFLILPVKIKWLALLTWAAYAVSFALGTWNTRCQILAATGNFFLFFGRDIFLSARMHRRRMATETRRFGLSSREPEARHRCRICGKTELTHPQLDFRYCSKCAGEQCYCSEHIFNHEHVLTDEKAGV